MERAIGPSLRQDRPCLRRAAASFRLDARPPNTEQLVEVRWRGAPGAYIPPGDGAGLLGPPVEPLYERHPELPHPLELRRGLDALGQ